MGHLSEEQLILQYYREGGAEAEAHLAECEACRAELNGLSLTLAAVSDLPVPERDESYGREVYVRLLPRLEEKRWWFTWWPRLATAGAMAVLLVAAFLAGRLTRPGSSGVAPVPSQGSTAQTRDRILLVAVGDHLERSQMVLIELSNAPTPRNRNQLVDISTEQQWAEDLVENNRLYRQTAAGAGEPAVAGLLDELERFLLEIAHSPTKIPASELERLRKRIVEKGILFKVRVVESDVREREMAPRNDSGRGKL